MVFFIHFAYPWVLYITLPIIFCVVLLRARYYKPSIYAYPLASILDTAGYADSGTHKKILFAIRMVELIILAVLLAKPRIVDYQSIIHGMGVDMVIGA